MFDQVIACLESCEYSRFDCPVCGFIVARVANESCFASVARLFKCLNDLSLFKDIDLARMELDKVYMVSLKADEASVNRFDDRIVGPFIPFRFTGNVSCLCGKKKFVSTICDTISD